MVRHNFPKNRGKETKIGHWPVIFILFLLRVGFFNSGETRSDLKCEAKEPSESNKLTIDGIRMSNVNTIFH